MRCDCKNSEKVKRYASLSERARDRERARLCVGIRKTQDCWCRHNIAFLWLRESAPSRQHAYTLRIHKLHTFGVACLTHKKHILNTWPCFIEKRQNEEMHKTKRNNNFVYRRLGNVTFIRLNDCCDSEKIVIFNVSFGSITCACGLSKYVQNVPFN